MPHSSAVCDFGWKAPQFNLPSTKGSDFSLQSAKGENGTLIMFICNHCPYVRSIENKISIETQRLKDINVNSIAFMSNDQSAYEEDHDQFLLKQISRAKFKFDYIVDNTQSIAKSFDAQCTPEFFYFNNEKKLKYRGRLDSNGKSPSMGDPELYSAVEECIAKGYCSNQQYPSMGCSIKWKS